MKRRETVLSLIAIIAGALLLTAIAASAQTYTPLYTYPIGSGAYSGIGAPQVMAQGQDGNLYSTIQNNGSKADGTVYKMTPAGVPTTIYSFCFLTSCTDGAGPHGGVTLGIDGNFYGTTQGGGTKGAGTAFKVTPTGTLTTLWNFTNGTDDSAPIYAPLQGQDGSFYGVSEEQYNGQNGTFFKLTSTGVLTPHTFSYTNGATPNLPTQGTDGNFYGTAQVGGDATCRCGVVYKGTAAGKITVLHKFTGYPSDGNNPWGILTQGSDGNFYGTTRAGGSANAGVAFKITPTGVYTVLHSFNSYAGDGTLPLAGMIQGPDGNFYGTTGSGGSKNAGSIFQLTPAGVEKTLYSFCSVTCSNGFGAATPLVLHTNGKFYGNTNGNSLGGAALYSFDMGFHPLVDLVTWTAKVGAKIGILGQGFTGTTGVSFGGVNAAFTNISDTYMTATVPTGALTGAVTVTTFTSSMKGNRNFLVKPQVKSFSPASGIVGTTVTITGVSLTQTGSVSIGGKSAVFTKNSDTQLTATVPAGAKTGAPISVATAGGVGASTAKFVVDPSIASFSPTSGPVGTAVTITGNTFLGTTKVTFGGVAATSYQVINDTKVDALVPSGAVTGPVAVTTAAGTATSTSKFTVTP
jgi:uncharacterized repeat protein (TIGR03803 family)